MLVQKVLHIGTYELQKNKMFLTTPVESTAER